MHEHSSCLAARRPQCKYQSLTHSISVDASCPRCPPVQDDVAIPNQAPALSGPRFVCCHVISHSPQPADPSYITGLGVSLIAYLSFQPIYSAALPQSSNPPSRTHLPRSFTTHLATNLSTSAPLPSSGFSSESRYTRY